MQFLAKLLKIVDPLVNFNFVETLANNEKVQNGKIACIVTNSPQELKNTAPSLKKSLSHIVPQFIQN
jgi:hypothetical protein